MVHGPAISSMSLGRAFYHSITDKLDAAHRYGYRGLELFFEDLEDLAESLPVDEKDSNISKIEVAARSIRQMCEERSIKILSMQPFYHYEGLLDSTRHEERLSELQRWFDVATILGTDLILIPSNFLHRNEITGDMTKIVEDLKKVATLGMAYTPMIRLCYESLAWGTYVNDWQTCWNVVKRVDMPNFGICLDTFNIAARVYADPSCRSGLNPDGKTAIKTTLVDLATTIDLDKVFLVQIADAEKLEQPLVEGHRFYHPEQPARMSWSRNCRLFYGEDQGYLPIQQISHAIIVELGYTGWASAELFNRRIAEPDTCVPEELARRGRASWERFVDDSQLSTSPATER